jgi:hypothetical protein
MKRGLILFLLVNLILSACAPKPLVPLPTVAPEKTEIIPTGARVTNIIEIERGFEAIEVSKIPAKNCKGQNVVQFSESMSRKIKQEITFGSKVDAGLAHIAIISLEREYQITNGEEIDKTVEINVEAKPGSYLEYQVLWKKVWAKGYVVLEGPNGVESRIPYTVTYSLQAELLDPVNIGCK